MTAAPLPANEAERLAALRALGILDTAPDAEFDALARAASLVCGAPIALLSLIDADRQWFKANLGLPGVTETTRDLAFCAHAILGDDILEVADARLDVRFADNALVTGAPDIRFYAGAPIQLSDGHRVGTLCVIDQKPRHLDETQRELLRCLAKAAAAALEGWRARRAERALLQRSEAHLQRQYEATPAMLHCITPDGRLLAVSDGWLAALGYSRAEALGRLFVDFLTPASRERAITVGRPRLLATGRMDALEFQIVRKDGEIIDSMISAVLEKTADGQPFRSLVVIEDITERKRTETALANEQRRLADVIAAGQLGTFEWNVQTDERRVNERWAEMLGYTAAELRPLSTASWIGQIHPDDRPKLASALERHFSGESEFYEFERRTRHRDGHWVWIVSRGKIITRTPDGKPEWIYGVVTDMTERRQQEEALRNNEELLERVGEVAGVGGWEVDLRSGAVSFSSQTYRIHGLPMDLPMTVDDGIGFYAPESRPVIRAALEQAAATGEGWDLELALIRADGQRIWVRSVGSAMFGDAKPIRLFGALQDITGQVTQRQALREANERLTLATDSGGIGIWELDIATGGRTWDSRMYRLYGMALGDGHPSPEMWVRRLHSNDRAQVEQAIHEAIAGNGPFDIVFRIVWDDGSIRHLRASGRLTGGSNGQPVRLIGTTSDITEPRRLAAELEKQNELLRVTLQSIGDGVITTDADGFVAWLNPAAERMTGWTSAEAAGREVTDVYRAIDDAGAAAPHRSTAEPIPPPATNGSLPRRARLVSRDGSIFGVEDSAAPMRDDHGRVLGMVLVFRDVTAQRRLEAERDTREREIRVANTELERLAKHLAKARDAAERASRAKSRFLAGMSHELRTPLNGILGYAQLLRAEGGLNPQQSARVDAMLGAGTHLLEMITSVLDMSAIEAEHVAVQSVEVDVPAVAARCLDVVGASAQAKGLPLSLTTAPEAPRRLVSDPMRLRQILLNLLGNAVKFTAAGAIELRLAPAGNGAALRIEVRDTGPGIPPAQRQRLFRDFARLDIDGTDAVEGAGLGLALSSRLTALLGGRLGHEPNPGGGSVFWLELPPAVPVSRPAATEAAPAPRAEAATAATRKLRVLVVDDVAMNRDIATSFLKVADHDVTCAEGGEEAVVAAASNDFDVILMDVRMPQVDGLEATRRIRRLQGARGLVPIVGLTAQTFSEQVAECIRAGMNGHIAKPYSPEILLASVARAAETQPTRDAAEAPVAVHDEAGESVVGADLPVLDLLAADNISAYLSPEKIAAAQQKLAARGEALLRRLRAPDADMRPGGELAEAAHALAGSAGMFGFARLAAVGQKFEQAVQASADDLADTAAGLHAAIEATVEEIHRRAKLGVEA